MGKHCIDLCGTWELSGKEIHGAGALTLEAQVPGHVHQDLLAAGHIRDPFWRDQALECQWIEDWDWHYARDFVLPPDFPIKGTMLECDGLDTFAEVKLNGTVVWESGNMFIPYRFGVWYALKPGANRIEITLRSMSEELRDKPREGFFACFAPERVFARRMQCGFGWDWVHRFVSAGIWRPIRLVGQDTALVEDIFVHTVALTPDSARIAAEITIDTLPKVEALQFRIIDPQGAMVCEQRMGLTSALAAIELEVPAPELWWPNGHGAQPIYTAEAALLGAGGDVLDTRAVRFGIRTISLDTSRDVLGSRFVFHINGRPIFAKGGNWVPADPFPGRIPDSHYERLLGLARDGGVNMLRAWGGGIYESPAFWEACDRLGIMITQDFLLACAQYPENDPDFLGVLEREFSTAIRILRNHPSLVLWSGDNELGMNDPPESNYWGKRIAEEVSGPLCAELDPSRPFRMTSPYGGKINNAPDHGDCHISAWYDPDFLQSDMENYREHLRDVWGRFPSEYVVVGMTPLASTRKYASEADLRDPEARILEFHNKDNPYNGIDSATHFQLLRKTAEWLYGASPDPLFMLRKMEYVQYEWVRLATESARRRKFDCAGLLFWMYNDCWPANGVALVDYWGVPKAGYYAMKKAFQPVVVCLEPREAFVRVWLSNDAPMPQDAQCSIRFQPWTGALEWAEEHAVSLPENGVVEVCEVERAKLSAQGVLVCDVTSPSNSDRAVFFDGMPRDMDFPPSAVRVQEEQGPDGPIFSLSSDSYARVVCLEGGGGWDDNYFDLLPGETRRVRRLWEIDGNADPVRVTWWNGGLPEDWHES